MDAKTVLGVVASLVIMGIAGGLALYRDVGVLRDQVAHLQADIDRRDVRERVLRDAIIRAEERIAGAISRPCAP